MTVVASPLNDHQSTKASLVAEDLSKAFGGKAVVDRVRVKVASPEVVGLLGPNGAGKTTTFYMIVGMIRPDSGRVLLNGKEITSLPMYRRARSGISYLPQEPSIFRRMTVAQNVMAILETLPLREEQRKQRLEELLAELGISHLRNQKAVTLSGGERRRVEICRSLVLSPSFMLLDEPFSGIDPIAVADIQKIIRSLKEKGIGILITDHNVRETLGICDRAYILNQGKIMEEGTPREIASSRRAREVYLGEAFQM
jgi:lipopolysaccharide export system ATP-binding protein